MDNEAQNGANNGGNPSCLGEVIPGLWIGNLAALQYVRKLPCMGPDDKATRVPGKEEKQEVVVVSLLSNHSLIKVANDMIVAAANKNETRKLEIRHENIYLYDDPRAEFLTSDLGRALGLMDEGISSQSCCLVHCAKGVSRSAAVCAAWLISRQQMSLEEAMRCLQKARPDVNPNLGFLAALRALEQSSGDVLAAAKRLQATKK